MGALNFIGTFLEQCKQCTLSAREVVPEIEAPQRAH